MEIQTIVTICLGVGTILASGVTSSVVTYRLNRTKDQFAFMRIKAEALYLAANEYGRTLAGYTLTYFPVIKGDIDWNEMLDMQIKAGSEKREHGGAELMTMLVEIYFPSVRPALADVFDARTEFNKFANEMKREYIRSGSLNSYALMPRMMEATTNINTTIQKLEAAIVEAARSFAGVRQQ